MRTMCGLWNGFVEGVPPAVLKTSVPAEIEIDFLAEAFYNDQIQAVCHALDPDSTEFHHGLIRPQDDRELVRAKTRWRKVD